MGLMETLANVLFVHAQLVLGVLAVVLAAGGTLHSVVVSAERPDTSYVKINICCLTQFTFSNGMCTSNLDPLSSVVAFANDQRLEGLLRSLVVVQEDDSELGSPEFSFQTLLPECSRRTGSDQTHFGRLSTRGTGYDFGMKADNTNTTTSIVSIKGNDNKQNDSHRTALQYAVAVTLTAGEIRPNGYLIHDGHFYPPTEYCINGYNEAEAYIELVICDHLCNTTTTTEGDDAGTVSVPVSCLPKCCEPDQLLHSRDFEFKCVSVHSNFSWAPVLHNESSPHEVVNTGGADTKLHFIHAHPNTWCKTDGFFMYQRDFPMNPKVPFHILKNGGIYYLNELEQTWEHLPEGSYCVDGIYDEELVHQPGGTLSAVDNNVIYYCPPEFSEEFAQVEESDHNQRISVLYYIVLIVSSTFLLLTIVIHAISLDRNNIHGRTLLCCFVSLFCLYIFLALLHGTRLYLDKDPTSTFCWAIGVGLHFFFLSTFSWLSVVNFDLWFTFRTLRTLMSPKSHRFKRFIIYAVFALGAPIVILAIALSMDYLYKDTGLVSARDMRALIVPGYGQDGCFFRSNEAALVYMYGPIGFLLLLNLFMFVLTIASMYNLKKTSSIATSTSNSYTNQPRQSFHLFLKLFVLMGVSWIFEVISWAAHPSTVPWYWIIFDLINICQGIFIFFIFTCKRSTLRVLEQKFPCFKGLVDTCRRSLAPLSCVKKCPCPSGSSSASNTAQEMSMRRKISDTVETDIGPASER